MGAGGEVSDLSGSKKGSFERERVNGITQPCGTRYVFQFGNETLLMEKARAEICQKLNEWNSATVTKSTIKNEKINVKENDGGEKSQASPKCVVKISLLSHCVQIMVKWTKGNWGVICIYPQKGDVWALYRNWSAEWNEITEDKVVHKYDMVEVLEDYSEELGVTVAPLVKVGFQDSVPPAFGPWRNQVYSKERDVSISHLIPSYLLTGQEGPNAPKGCLELDPAATPLELHQVIVDAKDVEILDNGETSKKEKR
ncbi:hypothetical protein GH714_006702 [Hevea brasiliensis]|uniref:DUF3444 domain-containing protein n=1 Tax=Hevea brasiliensis TaxID=3981 RepID=A0A6A6N1R5_HEVBR|nr:hypothetical protein GH714_006702 [Hevea brasiliensis]